MFLQHAVLVGFGLKGLFVIVKVLLEVGFALLQVQDLVLELLGHLFLFELLLFELVEQVVDFLLF